MPVMRGINSKVGGIITQTRGINFTTKITKPVTSLGFLAENWYWIKGKLV
jgi:hypothetical protein